MGFTNELYTLSTVVMASYLILLALTYYGLDFTPGTGSPFALKAGVSVNLAWICVASIINGLISTARSSTNTLAGVALPQIAGTQTLAVIVIVDLTLLTVLLLLMRSDAAFAGAAMWALWGVHREQAAKGAHLVAA